MIKPLLLINLIVLFSFSQMAHADEVIKNTAQMQAMDKITGRVSVINVPVNGEVKFGSLSIVVRRCQSRPVEETPDNFAFVDVTDTNLQGEEHNIFKGWMISSSPATHAVEHPIYDVWLLKCLDSEVDKSLLLSEEQLSERDSLPMQSTLEDGNSTENLNMTTGAMLTEIQAQEEPRDEPQNSEMSTVEFLYDEETSEDTEDFNVDENLNASEFPQDENPDILPDINQ